MKKFSKILWIHINSIITGRARLIQTRFIRNSTSFKLLATLCFPHSYHLMFKIHCQFEFHLFRMKILPMNELELTVFDLYVEITKQIRVTIDMRKVNCILS